MDMTTSNTEISGVYVLCQSINRCSRLGEGVGIDVVCVFTLFSQIGGNWIFKVKIECTAIYQVRSEMSAVAGNVSLQGGRGP